MRAAGFARNDTRRHGNRRAAASEERRRVDREEINEVSVKNKQGNTTSQPLN